MAISLGLLDPSIVGAISPVAPTTGALQTGFQRASFTIDESPPRLDVLASVILATAAIGALLLRRAPVYVDRVVDDLRRRPVRGFLTGLLTVFGEWVLVQVVVAAVAGMPIALALHYAYTVLGIAGITLGYVAAFAGRSPDRRASVLLVGLTIALVAVAPVVVGVVHFCVGSAGIGAIVREWAAG